MHYPKITVVTATLNRADFLEQCLKSVEEQTYRNIEHVFVEGYSSDNSVEIIKDYIKRNPTLETKFVQAEPKGIANALNIGLKHATGDVIHFLHDDDYYLTPDSLERVAGYFKKDKKLEWLVGNIGLDYKGKQLLIRVYNINKNHKLLKTMSSVKPLLQHENTFCTKDFYMKYGPFVEKNKIAVEYKIWLKALITTYPTPADEVFTIFIVHNKSMSSNPYNYLVQGVYEFSQIKRELKYLPIYGYYGDKKLYKKLKALLDK
jgi:glycosyltransferase